MSLVDDRGRVFGRYNLVDVAVAFVLLGLIPLGYGAYALFRTPLPKLTVVEPATRQFENRIQDRRQRREPPAVYARVAERHAGPELPVQECDVRRSGVRRCSSRNLRRGVVRQRPGAQPPAAKLHADARGIATGAARCGGFSEQPHPGTSGSDQGGNAIFSHGGGAGGREAGTRSRARRCRRQAGGDRDPEDATAASVVARQL